MDEQRTENRNTEGSSTESSTYTAIRALVQEYLQGGYSKKGMSLTDYLLARTLNLLQTMADTQEGIAQTLQGVGVATCDIADTVQSMDL